LAGLGLGIGLGIGLDIGLGIGLGIGLVLASASSRRWHLRVCLRITRSSRTGRGELTAMSARTDLPMRTSPVALIAFVGIAFVTVPSVSANGQDVPDGGVPPPGTTIVNDVERQDPDGGDAVGESGSADSRDHDAARPLEPGDPVQGVAIDAAETSDDDACRSVRRAIHARAVAASDLDVRRGILALMPDCSQPIVTRHPTRDLQQDDDQDDADVPPLSGRRLLGELVAGSAGTLAGAFGGVLVGAATKTYLGMGVGGMLGAAAGASAGVYLVGAAGGQHGSPYATLGGSLVGVVVALFVAEGVTDPKHGLVDTVAVAVGITTLGAMVGFNRTRAYRSGARPGTAWTPVLAGRRDHAIVGVGGRF
jgi:hypothetical protein